ncbi:hypothetical protein ACFV1U_29450 [Streptomyces microflavus]|uniref:hypothetical protein n=1 Tax=Streptomyces microflavus TaxID=1919 RepID=UPI0036BC6E16
MSIVAVGLKNLVSTDCRARSLSASAATAPQPLLDAIGNPRLAAVHAREVQGAKVHQAAYQAQLRKMAQE